MPDSNQLGEAPLEFHHERPAVRQPSPIEHVVDPRQKPLPVSNIRAADVKLFFKSRTSAEDGQISYSLLQDFSGKGLVGTPATVVCGPTWRNTTLPAPTVANSPTVALGRTHA